MNGNGNGWVKPVLVGIAVVVVSAAIVGSTSNTFSNSLAIGKQEVKVEVLEGDVATQSAAVAKIPVMAEQIKDIKEDVREILDVLKKE